MNIKWLNYFRVFGHNVQKYVIISDNDDKITLIIFAKNKNGVKLFICYNSDDFIKFLIKYIHVTTRIGSLHSLKVFMTCKRQTNRQLHPTMINSSGKLLFKYWICDNPCKWFIHMSIKPSDIIRKGDYSL